MDGELCRDSQFSKASMTRLRSCTSNHIATVRPGDTKTRYSSKTITVLLAIKPLHNHTCIDEACPHLAHVAKCSQFLSSKLYSTLWPIVASALLHICSCASLVTGRTTCTHSEPIKTWRREKERTVRYAREDREREDCKRGVRGHT